MGLFPTNDPEYSATYAEEAAMVDASELIAGALEASGVSRAELARALNVSRSEITERLRGDRNITVRNLAATLHALGATLELGMHAPTPTHAPLREPIDIGAYRGWVSPRTIDHKEHASYRNHYAGARR